MSTCEYSPKYQLVLADPPWPYNSRAHHSKTRFGGGVHSQYPVMSLEDICSMPVAQVVDDTALLFLWTTGPHLMNAGKVIEAWGFEYTTLGFTWIKQNRKAPTLFFGPGFYTRANAEVCLLGRRGKQALKPLKSVNSAVVHPIMEHSKKPETIQDRIEQAYPSLSKIELFARRERPGWKCLGNELAGNLDIRQALNKIIRSQPGYQYDLFSDQLAS